VIERGLLFTEDKLVPMDFVKSMDDQGVHLSQPKEALDKLNQFEETHYLPLDRTGQDIDAYYWYPPLSGINMGGYPLFPQPVYIEHKETNVPENYVALRQGARVISSDGEHIGNIERFLLTQKNDQVTHLVISSGILLKEEKLVPAHWIRDASEEEVHLSVEAAFVDRLAKYQHEG
jgi:hypothetical protein